MPKVHINNHDMYYEIHGEGDPAICMGGWGTYCHGGTGNLARGLTDKYQTLLIDYRGIGESTDDESVPATMKLHADDVMGLLDHLGWSNVRFIGLVGMGACIAQEVAIQRPELVRSMVNMGCWAAVDKYLEDQLDMFRIVHRDLGFEAFQRFVCFMSFLPEYYNQNHGKLIGPDGPWSELRDRVNTHWRLVDACISHDVVDQLPQVQTPTLVLHAAKDMVTSPRYTGQIEELLPNTEGVTMAEVAHVVAGKEQKIKFCEILFDFLERH
ncbi:MAG: alpha/beta hydrolase [Gammaproteobacteria bacterium]|nr:alpha/beta hydrolase [Gammaproteobacteria bacterium]